GQFIGCVPRPIHAEIYGAAYWLGVLGGKKETALRVLAAAQCSEGGEFIVPVLKDDADLQSSHHDGIAFSASQRFSRARFVFMVVVPEDRADADRLHLVQKALGHRG